jgi:hypothetical protein
MASRVQVCNMALGLIGAEMIASITAPATEAERKCALYIDQAIDETLRLYPWNCAIKRTALALLATAPTWGYAYSFSLPSDYIRGLWADYQDINFKIVSRTLHCDDNTFNLEYISRIGVNEMDAALLAAVIAKLAEYLAFAITNSGSMAEAMVKRFEMALIKATIADSQEGTPDEMDDNTFVNARI